MKTFLFVIMMLFLTTNTATAELITFFGEDILDATENTRLHVGEHPNADGVRSEFLSDLIGVGTEDFEGPSITTEVNGSTNTITGINFSGAGTATFTGAAQIISLAGPDSTNAGRYPISGTTYLEFLGFSTVAFTEQISAFGFYGTDIGDFQGQVGLQTFLGTDPNPTNTFNITSGTGNPGNVIYFAFIDYDNPFDRIEFNNTAIGADVFGFDDFTIGTLAQVKPLEDSGTSPVPEPSTIFLVSFGLIGLGALKRRFFH